MARGGGPVRELTDFLAIVATMPDAGSAYAAAVERAAAACEADLAALVHPGGLLAGSGAGLHDGNPTAAELLTAARDGVGHLDVRNKGRYAVLAEPLEHIPEGWLIVARSQDRPYAEDERHVLRGLCVALTLALRGNARPTASWQERQSLLERLSRIQRSISARAPLEDVLTAIVTGAADLLGDPVVGLRRMNPERPGWSRLVASAGMSPELAERLREGRVGEGVGGRAVAEGRLVVQEDYANAAEGLPDLQQGGLCAAMAAPVHENGEVVGSLVVASRRTGRLYSQAQRDTLVAFADHASLAMTDAETVRALHRALDRATHDALHDQLTGLANRALLHDRLGQALRRSSRSKSGLALLFLDLDGFKRVNDSLGHAVGDRLLVSVAGRLASCVRATDTTARVGGDEFAVLLEDLHDQVEAEKAGDRILAALREPFRPDDQEIAIDASIGIASLEDVSGADDILRNADLAMYEAKAAGKGQHRRFRPEMHVRSLARLELETALRGAMDEQQLEVHYQPIVELEGGSIVGTEALVRWRHPERGFIPPAEFIPIAESTGLILPIGEWVLSEACRQARQWQERYPVGSALSVSVNLSGRQFQQPGLLEKVTAALDRSRLAAQSLILDVTAGVLMQDVGVTLHAVRRLQEMGVRLAIDDFGTGEASLSCLRRFPIDIVKIDKSFVDGVTAGTDPSRLAHAMVNLARTLQYQTIAEGIEDAEQAAALRAFGCDLAQGYYFARPCPPQQLRELLEAPEPNVARPLAS